MTIKFCMNDPCETEATHAVTSPRRHDALFLCATCAQAFEKGQNEPLASIVPIEDYVTLDECPACGSLAIKRGGMQSVSLTEYTDDNGLVDKVVTGDYYDWLSTVSCECLSCGEEWESATGESTTQSG